MAAFHLPSLFCFVTSAHPHQSITNGTHYRVAQRVPASQSLVDALQLLPHRARPTPSNPAPCTSLRPLHAVPCPLALPLSLRAPIPSAPSLLTSSIIHPSINHPVCLSRSSLLLRLDWAFAASGFGPGLGLNWAGLVWSDISTSAGCPAVARDFPLDTHTHLTHPLCLSPLPLLLDRFLDCLLLASNKTLCDTHRKKAAQKHSHRIPTHPK